MKYPTKEHAMKASKYQLGIWVRFLPSPGMNYIGSPDFDVGMSEEVEVLNVIWDRFYNELGGWTPALSKEIGW